MQKKIDILKDKLWLANEVLASIRNDDGDNKPMHDCVIGGKSVGKMTLFRALLNACIYERMDDKYKLDSDFIFACNGDAKSTDAYRMMTGNILMNKYKLTPYEAKIDMDYIMQGINEYVYHLDTHTTLDFSIFDLIELAELDDELLGMFIKPTTNLDDSPELVAKKRAHCFERLTSVVETNKLDPMYTLLTSGSGLRVAQLVDVCFGIFWRPNGDEAYPHMIRESWLNGLRTARSFQIEHQIGRHAIILSKLAIEDTGVFGKQSSLSNQHNNFHKDRNYKCNTKVFKPTVVYDEAILNSLVGRYMDVKGKTKKISKDMSLIGSVVNLRSPSFCNSSEGICRFCATDTLFDWNVNSEYNQRNIGIQASKDCSADPGQGYLGAKHNQVVKLGKYTFIISHNGDRELTSKEMSDLINVKFGKISINGGSGDVYAVKPKWSQRYRRMESNSIRLVDMDISITGENTIFYFSDEGLIIEDLTKIGSHDMDINFKIPHEQLGNDFKALKTVFDTKTNMTLDERLDAVREVMVGRPPIIAEILMRGVIFTKDNHGDWCYPDYSDASVVDRLTFLRLEAAIKESTSIAIRLQLGWFRNVLSDPRMYDTSYTSGTITDLYFAKQGEIEE